MKYLHDSDYRTISTESLVRFMEGREAVRDRSIVIHFDDGSRSVLEAVPILEKYNFKAAFWIVAGKGIGGEHLEWNDIIRLSRHRNYEIYSHSLTHSWGAYGNLVDWADAKVPGRSIDDVERELAESKRILETQLGRPVPYLAWPFGSYNDKVISSALKVGYSALFTVDWGGANASGGDVVRVRRAYVSGHCNMDAFRKIVAEGQSLARGAASNEDRTNARALGVERP